MKKLMTAEEMIELMPATASEIAALSRIMGQVSLEGMPDWFVRGLAPPDQKVTTIAVNGRRVATIWTWLSAGNRELVVNAAVSLVKDDIFDPLFAGIKKVADLAGADRIAFTTMRRGLVSKARRIGFQPTGLLLEKVIAPIL